MVAMVLMVVCFTFGFVACRETGNSETDSTDSNTSDSSSINSGEESNPQQEVFIVENGVITDVTEYGKTLTEIIIPETIDGMTITSIGRSAFESCLSLTSVTIPDGVTSIGAYAFRGCSSLTSVTIGDSVTSIGNYAFYKCHRLTSITISNSVTYIGNGAFNDCSELTIYCEAESKPSGWSIYWDRCDSYGYSLVVFWGYTEE